MERASKPDQQAYLFACLDGELKVYLRGRVSDATAIWGLDGCVEMLEERFRQLYPKFTRRMAFFGYNQAKGQSFADYYAALRQKGDEAVLSGLQTDDLYVFWLIHGCSDEHLREKLTELKDPTCLLYTSPSPRDATLSRMPSSA